MNQYQYLSILLKVENSYDQEHNKNDEFRNQKQVIFIQIKMISKIIMTVITVQIFIILVHFYAMSLRNTYT